MFSQKPHRVIKNSFWEEEEEEDGGGGVLDDGNAVRKVEPAFVRAQ